ncbi:hypothetical protein QWZ16_18165 [Vibrio ostreicida]|uniref:Uncharacterized protein n=1 Tax=Vibrio ostreicida TaxID=526588 RepID=A0ABT8BZJ7_9VIBR|nr:hypothetical protein [Vibrio ostreicida]MDN3611527.1 hypothetical protein [Vibrio ostreicida]
MISNNEYILFDTLLLVIIPYSNVEPVRFFLIFKGEFNVIECRLIHGSLDKLIATYVSH